MTRTTTSNPTGVHPFDHTRLAALPEYAPVGRALDTLVQAMNAQDINLTQAEFLTAVTDIAASLAYADGCRPCMRHDDEEVRRNTRPVTPYRTHIDGNGWLTGHYRCPAGHTWTSGWSTREGLHIG